MVLALTLVLALAAVLFSAIWSQAPPRTAGGPVLNGSPTGASGTADAHRPAARQRVLPARTRPQHGLASYYASYFDGRTTASGVRFDNDEMLAAHPTYPFGTIVRVTNLVNGRSVDVRIVDRGPARSSRAAGVIIDVSRAAADALGFVRAGRTRVRLDVLRPVTA